MEKKLTFNPAVVQGIRCTRTIRKQRREISEDKSQLIFMRLCIPHHRTAHAGTPHKQTESRSSIETPGSGKYIVKRGKTKKEQ